MKLDKQFFRWLRTSYILKYVSGTDAVVFYIYDTLVLYKSISNVFFPFPL